MRLRSDALCWLRRTSRDGSCRLVIQNGAGAPETTAGQGNPHRFFHLAYPAITLSIFATCHAKPARLSLTSFRRATVSSYASGLSGTASLGHVSSAARLLCKGDLSRAKECANSHCGAFFQTPARTAGVGARRPAGGTAFGSPRSTNAGATNLAQGLKPTAEKGRRRFSKV